ncbi:MAG: 6-phosphogluconolactonase [Acidobacteria bacterium]|nr:6-phosphogluconolactonase [Acidobacteriota bacterium]
MTNERRVLVHPDVEGLIAAVAARFLTKLTDLLDEYHHVNVALTGGTAGGQGVQHAIASSPMRGAIDWSRVHFWWGDERFLPQGDPDRNETQAREALLDHIPVPPENIHPFPSSDVVSDIEEAAGVYAAELAAHADPALRLTVPRFDITFLGVGPDGHIASLFPEHDVRVDDDRLVIADRHSPKPPPERLSLTLPVINSSQRIWMVLAGAEKASALGLALAGASPIEVPAAGAQGRRRTVFFVDQEAAEDVPQNLIASSY